MRTRMRMGLAAASAVRARRLASSTALVDVLEASSGYMSPACRLGSADRPGSQFVSSASTTSTSYRSIPRMHLRG
ncbi:unnamed protein product [Polarella glacialis]|uniref:Uncharacterized protein n=1 Tax=Polarella glacialis TaxID=89957 RepID=A0A813E0Z4_POLGL|nr:unnamed protein product [Polarella glacialis]